MTPPPDDVAQSESPPTDHHATEDEIPIVFEFAVPSDELALEMALREFPSVTVEYERLVPTNDSPLPYLWTSGGTVPEFREAMAADPKVERLTKAAAFEEGALYHIHWEAAERRLLKWVATTHENIVLLQAVGRGDEWTLKFRFPSRSRLADFQAFADEQNIDLRVIRLYDLTDPMLGQYNISSKQRDALLRALEMGYFEVPREATLKEVAASLDISPNALSERLRRGQTNLVSNALAIGQPTGVGVGDQ